MSWFLSLVLLMAATCWAEDPATPVGHTIPVSVDLDKDVVHQLRLLLPYLSILHEHTFNASAAVFSRTTGSTNHVYRVDVPVSFPEHHPDITFGAKVFGRGTDVVVDRRQEHRMLDFLEHQEFAPHVFHPVWQNGFFYTWTLGEPLDALWYQDDSGLGEMVMGRVAALHLVDWQNDRHGHGVANHPHSSTSELWERCYIWFDQVDMEWFFEHFDVPTRLGARPWLSVAREQLRLLREELDAGYTEPLTIVHSDLSAANLLRHSQHRTVVSLHMLDWEYAYVGEPSFDLGNMFAEWGGNALDGYDWSVWADEEEVRECLLHSYLAQYNAAVHSPLEYPALLHKVELMAGVSHVMWGTWGFLMQQISPESSIDYLSYGISRFLALDDLMDSMGLFASP